MHHENDRAVSVTAEDRDGNRTDYPCDHVISSMPISQLLQAMEPPAADTAEVAADDLRYRDFLTVALVVPEEYSFPDNWIYVHSREVQVGRIQNFGSWSPYLVKEGRTCLGLEFFVFEGDETWNKPDAELVEQGKRELGDPRVWSTRTKVEAGYVVRMPKAYPFYDAELQGERRRASSSGSRTAHRTCTPSGATACTATTTRTTRCTPRCSRSRTSRPAPSTTCGASTSRRSTTRSRRTTTTRRVARVAPVATRRWSSATTTPRITRCTDRPT